MVLSYIYPSTPENVRDHIKVQGTVAAIVAAVLLVSAVADAVAARLDGRRSPG